MKHKNIDVLPADIAVPGSRLCLLFLVVNLVTIKRLMLYITNFTRNSHSIAYILNFELVVEICDN